MLLATDRGSQEAERPLTGKTAVVTGTLPSLLREQVKALAGKLGTKPSYSVSKKASALVAGEAADSKLARRCTGFFNETWGSRPERLTTPLGALRSFAQPALSAERVLAVRPCMVGRRHKLASTGQQIRGSETLR